MIQKTELNLWPTRVSFYEFSDLHEANKFLYDYAVAATNKERLTQEASERRVRHILDSSEEGLYVKSRLFDTVRDFLGNGSEFLDTDYCENRALVMGDRSFINTHKDSREGDITCVYFLSGGGEGQPINSVGNPRFVLEDATRYFDEPRLPFETRHGYSVNPRSGLAVLFPSYVPHNQHPYVGDTPHVQIVANFRLEIPSEIEEAMFD
jgi:hypothetical protein